MDCQFFECTNSNKTIAVWLVFLVTQNLKAAQSSGCGFSKFLNLTPYTGCTCDTQSCAELRFLKKRNRVDNVLTPHCSGKHCSVKHILRLHKIGNMIPHHTPPIATNTKYEPYNEKHWVSVRVLYSTSENVSSWAIANRPELYPCFASHLIRNAIKGIPVWFLGAAGKSYIQRNRVSCVVVLTECFRTS